MALFLSEIWREIVFFRQNVFVLAAFFIWYFL